MADPETVAAAVSAYEREGAHLVRTQRSLALVEEALRGRRFRSRLVTAGIDSPSCWTRSANPGTCVASTVRQLGDLAQEIREFLVASVSRTGGHLGPNLGAVELTLALHRVFDSPHDRILWDTGHQAYVHKIVTGRAGGFDRLRQKGGLSGYPSRAESDHDIIENSHASTALSYADGLAKAFQLRGETDRHVVAVVGDGSLTGGMAWEALNNIAADHTRRPRHRRQRQRAFLRADDRRARAPPRDVADHPWLRAVPRVGQAGPRPHAGRRRPPLYEPCTA